MDDHAVFRRGLKEILADEFRGTAFSEAGNAAEAFQHLHRQEWDVVILDISMPGESGLEVLKEAKRLRPRTVVLVLSMHSEDQYAVRVLRAGASGYLTKEMAPERLVAAVRKTLSGGRYVSDSLAEKLALRLGSERDGPLHEALSDREYHVMCLIALGKTVTQIARELSLSVKTISTYRARILEKMKMKSNADLIRYALENSLQA